MNFGKVSEGFFDDIKHREEVVRLLSSYEWSYLVTLNFNHVVTETKAQSVIDIFRKSLNVMTFGRSSKKALRLAVSLETHAAGGFHVHLLIENPIPRISEHRRGHFDFREAIIKCWEGADKSTANILKSCPDKTSWYEEIYDAKGACEYITKEIMRGRENVIQWDLSNFHGKYKIR